MEQISPETIQFILGKLANLNDDYTQLAVDVGVLKAQVGQILQYQKIILGGFVSIVVGIVIFIFRKIWIKLFNNKK